MFILLRNGLFLSVVNLDNSLMLQICIYCSVAFLLYDVAQASYVTQEFNAALDHHHFKRMPDIQQTLTTWWLETETSR